MLSKTKTVILDYIFPNLRDVRFLGLMTLGVLVLLTSWSGMHIIELNYGLQKEIAALEARNQVRRLENENLKLKNEYLKTDSYLELTARQQFGKGGKDEKLILVPKEISLSKAPILNLKPTHQTEEAENTPTYITNLRAWRDFFLHRT